MITTAWRCARKPHPVLDTGAWANQATGRWIVRLGDTVRIGDGLGRGPEPGIDFLPLTVDYRENLLRATIPRRPSSSAKAVPYPLAEREEILTSRMIDRPLRRFFPEAYVCD